MALGMRKLLKNRHVLWNWECSPDSHEIFRYHFVVGSDKRREGIINQIINDSENKIIVINPKYSDDYSFWPKRTYSGGAQGAK